MERSKQISAMCESDEEKMLLIRVCDKLERAMDRAQVATTCFLTPRQQALVRKILPQCAFFGGTEGTERNVAYVCPEYVDEPYDAVSCIEASFYEKNALSHRDVLGALMGAGIWRESVGDIIIYEDRCQIFVLSELKQYLLDNLISAGRHHLSLCEIDPLTVQKPPQKMKELRITVSSMRLDSVISGAFHLSRGRSAELIRAGQVAVNALTCLKPDRAVQETDEISARGMGKMKILALNGQTKKERFALNIGIYL